MLICKDQKAYGRILLAESEMTQECPVMYAAKELRFYLGRITAAPLQIEPAGSEPMNPEFIPLADHDIILGSASGITMKEPNIDGFIIKVEADKIRINGGERGIIYAVYELLERLGCRFFTRLAEKIPVIPTLDIPEYETEQKPAFEFRRHNYADIAQYPGFAVKCRMNGTEIPDYMGGYMEYALFVHSFETLVPTDVYRDSHPEYFSLINGERYTINEGRTQLCLTNPDVLKVATESTRKILLQHPKARIISISQNDNHEYCQCEKCKASDLKEGSAAGTLLKFVNAIAETLEPEFPDVIFDTLAYEGTRPAPTTIRNRHNVCVRLCSIESCFTHPFETCDDETRSVIRPDGTKVKFIDDLREWGRICDRMYIWDYTTCFAHYPTPHPNWRVLQPNVQAMYKNNVKGVFEQANGASRGGVDFNELRAYLISKLLWDPYCDLEQHRKEFMEYYYGAAAPHLDAYLNLLCDICEKENIHVGFNDHPLHAFLTEARLDEYETYFDKAAAAVAGDALRLARVEKGRLSIRWVRMKRKSMLQGIHDPEEINQFFEDWKEHGLSRIDEWVNVPKTHRAFLERHWRGVDYLPHFTDEEPEVL